MKFYIDGTLRGTTAIAGGVIPASNRAIWIGGNEAWGSTSPARSMDSVIYNKALSQAEIQALMVPTYDLTVAVNRAARPIRSGFTRMLRHRCRCHRHAANRLCVRSLGWRCTGSGACSVTMDAAKSVTAYFTQITYDLTVAVDGSGTTNPAVGVHTYAAGTVVDVTHACNRLCVRSPGLVPARGLERAPLRWMRFKSVTAYFHAGTDHL